MRRRLVAAFLLLAALLPGAAHAELPLFASDTLLELTLIVDFGELCRPRENEDCDFTATTLEYPDEAGRRRSLTVEVKVRGGWRSLTRNCTAPLLWVRFNEDEVAGTPFEGQSLLPLTTHCGKGLSLDPSRKQATRSDYEQYLLREYLGHRLYRQLTEYAVGARLVRISYPHPGRSRQTSRHYAFFTEHFESVATRTGSEWLPRPSFDEGRLDAQAAAILAMFHYMIGNTDWSIARERNTTLLLRDGRHIPMPYDLDMSGLVDAVYAGPAPGLPIQDVRQRFFLGYCHPDTDWDSVFALFDEHERSLLSLAGKVPGMQRKSRRKAEKYLDEFFDIIARPEERTQCIVQHCQPWPPAADDHLSPRQGE